MINQNMTAWIYDCYSQDIEACKYPVLFGFHNQCKLGLHGDIQNIQFIHV